MSKFTATLTLTFEPFAVTDEAALAKPVAEAIRAGIAAAIRAAPPRPGGHRPWNATGKLVEQLRIERNRDGSWSVLPPADRLQTDELMQRLFTEVPALRDPLSLPGVQEAIAKSLESAVK